MPLIEKSKKINMDHFFDEKTPLADSGNTQKPRILVAPLDWGLGHATRCVPVIRELIHQNCEVWMAGDGGSGALLRLQFPELPFLHLPGYHIQYSKKGSGLAGKIIRQIPKIKRSIRQENEWLNDIVSEYKFDALISDNRYGLYHPDIPCIIITHQLLIKNNLGSFIERWLQKVNYRYIQRFSACWVPDYEPPHSLAGQLSYPALLPEINLHYIGILSRFRKLDIPQKKNHLLIMISGPEPQRSVFEEKILSEIHQLSGTATLVRGLPDAENRIPSTNTIHIYNHLDSLTLNKEMSSASLVICRSGYSSLMDIVRLQKKSVLIPTPGQPEQIYLAKTMMEKKISLSIQQQDFSLLTSIQKAESFSYSIFPEAVNDLLKTAIRDLIQKIEK